MNETYDVVVIGGGAGLMAAAAINRDLVAADAERAVTMVNMRECA